MNKSSNLRGRITSSPASTDSGSARRQSLLEHTRKEMGSGRFSRGRTHSYEEMGIPAVHPRYQASYRSIYPEGYGDEGKSPPATLYWRILAALCLFFLFILCDHQKLSWNGIDTVTVAESISDSESFEAVSHMIENFKDGL